MRIAGILGVGLAALIVVASPSWAQSTKPKVLVTSAVTDRLLVCNTGCNLTSIYLTSGATAGFLMTFNAAVAPADGAVTPLDCIPVAANNISSIDYGSTTVPYSPPGLIAVFSSTGCYTLTKSATAQFIKARKTGGTP